MDQLALQGEGAAATAPSPGSDPDDPYEKAMATAGRLLSIRARTTAEIRDRLADKHPPAVVDRAVLRLHELALLDDMDFARRWVEERSRRKRLGSRALVIELEAKGVAADTARAAVAEGAADEETRATELAATHLPRLARLPLRVQAARLTGVLARKGYDPDVVQAAVKAVLPPEGWD